MKIMYSLAWNSSLGHFEILHYFKNWQTQIVMPKILGILLHHAYVEI